MLGDYGKIFERQHNERVMYCRTHMKWDMKPVESFQSNLSVEPKACLSRKRPKPTH